MQTDSIQAGFTAAIYSPGGRRVCARIRTYPQPRPAAFDSLPPAVVGDAQLHAPGVYAPESGDAAQLCATLCAVRSEWPDLRGRARPGCELTPARSESVLRGIYAMGAQAAPCPVRAHRSEWDALTAAWRESGWTVWLALLDGRPQAYAVLSCPTGTAERPMCARLHECVALPDSGLTLADVLAAAQAAGICAPDGAVCASALTID